MSEFLTESGLLITDRRHERSMTTNGNEPLDRSGLTITTPAM